MGGAIAVQISIVKSSIRFCLLGASVVILAQACGSSDDKKKAQRPTDYVSGGEAGEGNMDGGGTRPTGGGGRGGGTAGSGGTSTMTGGTPASGGNSDAGTGSGNEAGQTMTTPEGGSGGAPNPSDGGMTGADAGAGGQGSTVPTCQAGYAECDNNPDTVCETPLNLVTSCGDCDTKCVSTNGSASCTDNKCVLKCNQNYDNCDAKPENGCETNLVSNDKNCGVCGKDCSALGATCSTNLCSAIALQQDVPFSSDNSGARAWGFSPLGILENGFNSYTLRRMTLDGKDTLTVWNAPNKTSPTEGMVVVDNDVYWSERGATKTYASIVYKKAITDDAATLPTPVFVPEFSASFMRRQGNNLYWASGGYQDEAYYVAGGGGFIYTRALDALDTDGGTRIVNVDQGKWDDFKNLAVTTDALYWVTDSAGAGTAYELRTAPLNGTPISVVPAVFVNASVAVSNYYSTSPLVADGAYVYFGRDLQGDPQDGVYRYKTGMAKPERITLADNVISLLVDANYVYFTQQNVSGAFRAPINNGSGGAAEKIVAGNVERLIGMDANYLYGVVSTACCSGVDFIKIIK